MERYNPNEEPTKFYLQDGSSKTHPLDHSITLDDLEEAWGPKVVELATEEGIWPEPAIICRQLAAVRRGQRKRSAAGRRYEARARAERLRERGISY